jgi:hypothetical protein
MRLVRRVGRPRLVPLVAVALAVMATSATGADPKEVKELKVLAQSSFVDSAAPFSTSMGGTIAVRSVEELVAESSQGRAAKDLATARKDADIQKAVEKQLAATLKVEKIDWGTQMVVVVSTDSGSNRRANPKVELLTVKASGEKVTLTVAKGQSEYAGYGRYPGVVALVEKHDGKVSVEWKREK